MRPALRRLRKKVENGKVPFTVLALFVFLSLDLLFIWLMLIPSMNQENLLYLFNRRSDTMSSGVSAENYPRLAEAVSGFLSGRRITAQTKVEASEGTRAAFSEKELIHLQDIKSLMDLSRNLLFSCFTLLLLAVLLLLRGNLLRRRPFTPLLAKVLLYAGGALVFLLMAAAAWGIFDFDGAFTFLHRLVFTNKFWLLDPRNDLLIQLMPQNFFEEYAIMGLKNIGWALAGLKIMLLGLNMIDRREKH